MQDGALGPNCLSHQPIQQQAGNRAVGDSDALTRKAINAGLQDECPAATYPTPGQYVSRVRMGQSGQDKVTGKVSDLRGFWKAPDLCAGIDQLLLLASGQKGVQYISSPL